MTDALPASITSCLAPDPRPATAALLAERLAALMQEIHGDGEWKAHIDHGANTSFVLIRPYERRGE